MVNLSIIDFYSSKPELSYGNASSYSTPFSVIVSAIILLLTYLINKDTFFDWLYQINPQVTTELSHEYGGAIPINTPQNKLNLCFEYFDLNSYQIRSYEPNQSELFNYVEITLTNTSISHLGISSMTQMPSNLPYFQINSSEVRSSDVKNTNSSIVIIPITYRNVKLELNEKNYDRIHMLNFESEKVIINLDKATRPYTKNVFKTRLPFNNVETKIFEISYKRETFDVQGSYFKNVTRQYQFYSIEGVNNIGSIAKTLSDNDNILTVIIDFSPTHITTKIIYLNETDLISTFGGTFGILTLVGQVLNSAFSSYSLAAFKINALFKFYIRNSQTVQHHKTCRPFTISNIKCASQMRNSMTNIDILQSNMKVYDVNSVDILETYFKSCCKHKKNLKIKNISQAILLQERLCDQFLINRALMFYFNVKDALFKYSPEIERFAEFPDIIINQDPSINPASCFSSSDEQAGCGIHMIDSVDFQENFSKKILENISKSI